MLAVVKFSFIQFNKKLMRFQIDSFQAGMRQKYLHTDIANISQIFSKTITTKESSYSDIPTFNVLKLHSKHLQKVNSFEPIGWWFKIIWKVGRQNHFPFIFKQVYLEKMHPITLLRHQWSKARRWWWWAHLTKVFLHFKWFFHFCPFLSRINSVLPIRKKPQVITLNTENIWNQMSWTN